MKKHLFIMMALMLSGSLLAQHKAVRTTTDLNKGVSQEYGYTDTPMDRATMADPTIIWQTYEGGATVEDVFYIEETGEYFVNYSLNDMRVELFDAEGNSRWVNRLATGGRATACKDGNVLAYSDANTLYVVNGDNDLIFTNTFDYPISRLKLDSKGSRIYVAYGQYEANYYELVCINLEASKEQVWETGNLGVNIVGLSLPKNDSRLIVAFAQGYKQIWVFDPLTGEVLQNDLYYYDNSPTQDPALSANGDYLAYTDFSGMGYLYHWEGDRYESVWTVSVAGEGASSTWGCGNAISDDGSLIAFGTLDFVSTSYGYDGCAYLFNNYSTDPVWTYSNMGDEVTQMTMSADGSLIGAITWGPIDHSTPDFFLFRKQSNEPIAELNTPGSMEHIDMSYDGSKCIFGGKAVHCREMGSGNRTYAVQCITDDMGSLEGIANLGGDDNSNVTVTITDLDNYYEMTDAEGHYIIRAIPEGNYTVKATIPGYLPLTFENIAIVGGETTTLDFDMEACGTPITDLYASQGAEQFVLLFWSDKDDATGYNIYRKTSPNAPFGAPYASIDAENPAFMDENVILGQAYYYVVTATLDADLETPYSNQVMGYATDAAIPAEIDVFDGTAPTIDGIITEGEWDDAFQADVTNYLEGYAPGSVIMHFKMDNNYLYVCSESHSDTEWTNSDGVAMYIDDNNDGTYPEAGDDSEGNYWMYYGEPATVRYRPIYNTGGIGTTINLPEEIIACGMTDEGEVIEFALPLGEDETWQLHTNQGASGLYLFVRDAATSTMFGKWPAANNETFAPTYYSVMNYHVTNAVPEAPANLRVDEAMVSEGQYAPIFWDMPEMNDFDHFNFYIVGGETFEAFGTQIIIETEEDTDYSVYVTTVDHSGQESEPSETLSFHTGCLTVGETPANTVNVYPNPAHNTITISTNLSGKAEVKVIDVTGRLVKHFVSHNVAGTQLNVENLQSGMYFIMVSNGSNTTASKFIVE